MTSRPRRLAPRPAPKLSQVVPRPRGGRRPQVTQACESCREGKRKCDGGRPKCRSCTVKTCPCVYFGEHGKTRAACAKERLELCERVLSALRDSPPDEAARLLHRIRSGTDILDIWRSVSTNDVARAPSEQMIDGNLQELDTPSFDGTPETPGSELARSGQSGNDDGATPSSRRSTASNARLHDDVILGRDVGVSVDSTKRATRGTESGLPTASPSPHASTSILKRLLLPEAPITHEAIKAFFACSNKLLHVFTQEQLTTYHRSVFESPSLGLDQIKPRVGCLMAAAAVGAQHLPDEFGEVVETAFYELAKYFFEDVARQQPLGAIKLCVLMAQYNIFAKSSTAITYIEMGISLARTAGLNNHATLATPMIGDEGSDVRRTWRSLIYLYSWLSSTLGFVSESALASTQGVVLHSTGGIGGNIIDERDDEAINAIRDDLQTWYNQLPKSLHLQATAWDGSKETKRSVLHMHLLYLGAIMLLYRRIAAQRLRNPITPADSVLQPSHTESTLLDQSRDALAAAHNSARILRILRDDQNIFKRCWLIIFQAYTACTILLLAASQKQAHGLGAETQLSEKEHASQCISVLKHCSTADPVATMFYRQLRALFDVLFGDDLDFMDAGTSLDQQSVGRSACSSCLNTAEHRLTQAELVDDRYLLCIPSSEDGGRAKHSLALFLMLSQPFGDPHVSGARETRNVNFTPRHLPLRDHRDASESSFWGAKAVPFTWDLNKWELAAHIRSPEDVLQSVGNICNTDPGLSRTSAQPFVGNHNPHGWAAVYSDTQSDLFSKDRRELGIAESQEGGVRRCGGWT